MDKEPYISVEKASNIILNRSDDKTTLRFPYKIIFKNECGKIKKTKCISLKLLMNAIRLTNLNHPQTGEQPEPVDIKTIISCYIIGSAVNPEYKTVIRRYLFGLYEKEKRERVIPDDIDIICFTKGLNEKKHIKSLSSWEITIHGAYGNCSEKRYCNFDVSFIPCHHINYEHNKDFTTHIRKYGVCIMGKNIIGAKRYSSWTHDTIKDIVACDIPRESNVSGEIKKTKNIDNRFDILDIRDKHED